MKKRITKKFTMVAIAAAVILAAGLLAIYISRYRAPGGAGRGRYVRLQGPEMLTYDELVTLGASDEPGAGLEDKLQALTTTPFVSNEAYCGGA